MRWRMQYISDALYDKSQLDIWDILIRYIHIYPVHIYVKKRFFTAKADLILPAWKYFLLSNLESTHNACISDIFCLDMFRLNFAGMKIYFFRLNCKVCI